MTGTVFVFTDEVSVLLDHPTVRFHLVEVFRADGPRAGDRMGWAVWDTIGRSPEGGMGMELFHTAVEAVEALDTARLETGWSALSALPDIG
jgi:hypothetical protein